MELEGKVGIVTGGCSGIGYAVVEAFLKEGANVVIADYNPKGDEIVKNFGYESNRVRFFRTDISNDQEVQALVEYTINSFGKVDIAVACAGIPGSGDVVDQTLEKWHKILSVDLDGVFLTNKYVIKQMLKQNIKGSIINVASIGGLIGFPHDITYCSAKGAVVNFTRSAAVRVAENGIRVNALAPGYVQTALLENLPKDVLDEMINLHPMKRIAKAQEIADAIVFLASDKSSFITGITLPVDGGYTAV